MYAVAVDWLGPETYVACGFCNKIVAEVYSLIPINDEEHHKLEETLGDKSNWWICGDCLEKLENKTGCKIEITDAETVAEYDYEHFEKQDLTAAGGPIEKINEKSLLCPVCKNDMNIFFSPPKPKDIDIIKGTTRYKVKVQCGKCNFIYSSDRALTRCGSIIDCNEETITLEHIPIPFADDIKEKTVQNILTSDKELKGVVYKHDNFDVNALKALQDMGELLEFLIIDDKIVRILTGYEGD